MGRHRSDEPLAIRSISSTFPSTTPRFLLLSFPNVCLLGGSELRDHRRRLHLSSISSMTTVPDLPLTEMRYCSLQFDIDARKKPLEEQAVSLICYSIISVSLQC